MIDQQVAALVAREAIRDLPLRYCDCVWRSDVDGIVELFTQDGSFTTVIDGQDIAIVGSTALRDFYVAGLVIKPRPFIHNHVLDLRNGTSASGRCYVDLRSASNNMEWLGAGYYEDEYIANSDGWKFQARRFTVLRMNELPPVLEGT